MSWTMLRREVFGRTRHTVIVAAGLALAIALVVIGSSLAAGVKQAQADTLSSLYGVGTDLTVTGIAQGPAGGGGGPRFDFDGSEEADGDGRTELSQSTPMVEPGRATMTGDVLDTILDIDGVSAATGALSLTQTTFTGEMPDMSAMTERAPTEMEPPTDRGSSFGIDSVRVLAADPAETSVGPLSGLTLEDGRPLEAGDTYSAVVSEAYAAANDLAVGDTVDIADTAMAIVGIASGSETADVIIPLDVGQGLSGTDGLSTIYVTTGTAMSTSDVEEAIADTVSDVDVSSQADLADQVSGSLSSASSIITALGTWVSIIAVTVAIAIAVLLTLSGVSRRTREFGTLKAVGWSNRRVVAQVTGESMVQSMLGGIVGLILGLICVVAVNVIQPTIGGTAETTGPGGGMPSMPSMPGAEVIEATVLTAPISATIILVALALALLGGAVAGGLGAWRAARLSPAEALRTV